MVELMSGFSVLGLNTASQSAPVLSRAGAHDDIFSCKELYLGVSHGLADACEAVRTSKASVQILQDIKKQSQSPDFSGTNKTLMIEKLSVK